MCRCEQKEVCITSEALVLLRRVMLWALLLMVLTRLNMVCPTLRRTTSPQQMDWSTRFGPLTVLLWGTYVKMPFVCIVSLCLPYHCRQDCMLLLCMGSLLMHIFFPGTCQVAPMLLWRLFTGPFSLCGVSQIGCLCLTHIALLPLPAELFLHT